MKLFIIIKSIVLISLLFLAFNYPINISNEKEIIDEYIGYLIIPSIDMNLGFYDISDKRNDIEYNIEILKSSKEGSLFIAGHSGVGKKAFFNDLAKVKVHDEIYIKYLDNDYKYLVMDIYKEKKNGSIKINKKENEKILILTTCDQIKKGYQLVIKAVLQ